MEVRPRLHGLSQSASSRLPPPVGGGWSVADLLFACRGGFRGSLVRTCWLAHYTIVTICRSTNLIHNALENGTAGELVSVGSPHCLRRGKREGFFACPNPNDCTHSAVRRRLPPVSICQGVVAFL
jgi:hypothetical protein